MKSADKYYIFTAEKERLNINVVSMDKWDLLIYYTTEYLSDVDSKVLFYYLHIMKYKDMALAQVRKAKSRHRELKGAVNTGKLYVI